jgi:hypothetical protein
MNGGNATDAIISRLKEKAGRNDAVREIKLAFGLADEPAAMMLRGLRAAGIKDVGEWLLKQGTPQRGSMKAAVDEMLRKGLVPPTKISWKAFYNAVRDACPGGWINKAKGRKGFGFNDKTIWRAVRDVNLD